MSTSGVPGHTTGRHGAIRGADAVPRSRSFEGRFGRMHRLPADQLSEGPLHQLASAMVASEERTSKIPAGYTYLGQFIGHDLTFDPASSLQRTNDVDALVDYRTPRFDLDCVYGRGPEDQPYLYQADGVRMLLGETLGSVNGPPVKNCDVPRYRLPAGVAPAGARDRALIGDPRNDENVIISQLHGVFLRFHNRVVDELGGTPEFAEAQKLVRWHYQWILLYDYLKTIVNRETYAEILPHTTRESNPVKHPPKLRFYKPKVEAYIPIEFSAAAFRFGHSMVRQQYKLNRSEVKRIGGPFRTLGMVDGKPDLANSLAGFHRFNRDWTIDWSLFFERVPMLKEEGKEEGQYSTIKDVQRAQPIDPLIAEPLLNLPNVGHGPSSLAARNLIRGWRMDLPSGQAIAKSMQVAPLSDKELFKGIDPEIAKAFAGKTPLWYYILCEARRWKGKLGPVGGRIVAETFVGIMLEDGHSFLRQDPLWQPLKSFLNRDGNFYSGDFVAAAMKLPLP